MTNLSLRKRRRMISLSPRKRKRTISLNLRKRRKMTRSLLFLRVVNVNPSKMIKRFT